MKLFRKTPKRTNSNLFEVHIAHIQEIMAYYQKAVDAAEDDTSEKSITIYNSQGEIVHTCTKKLACYAINQHCEWLATLQKMQRGKNISTHEHASLLKVPFFQEQEEMKNYARVENTKKYKRL